MPQFVLLFIIPMALFVSCGRKVSVPIAQVPADEVFFGEGVVAFHEGTPESYARSIELFRKASQLKPLECGYTLHLAQALLFLAAEQVLNREQSEPRRAEAARLVTANETCVGHDPFLLRLRAMLAGRGSAATALINQAVEFAPNDAMNWLVLGMLDPTSKFLATVEGSGKWVAMLRAAELQPTSALFQYELGNNYAPLHDKQAEAHAALMRATERSPRHFRSYLALAYSATEPTDPEPLYRRVIEIAPNFLEGRLAFGSYYAALEEIDRAAEQYAAALSVDSQYDTAHFRLGLLMLQAEKSEEAERHFNAVIALNPDSYEAFYYLGNIAYAHNNLEQAKRDYQQAVRKRTNYAEAEYALGHVFRQEKQDDLAIAQFEKVMKLQPDNGDTYFSRADIRSERAELREALSDYRDAILRYEERIKSINTTIAYAEFHIESRVLQVEKRRSERDKARVTLLLDQARQHAAELEQSLRTNR